MNFNSIRIQTAFEDDDIRRMALSIIDLKSNGLVQYWNTVAFIFLCACIRHNIHATPKFTGSINDIDRQLTGNLDSLLNEMKSSKIKSVSETALTMLNRPEADRQRVLDKIRHSIKDYNRRQNKGKITV